LTKRDKCFNTLERRNLAGKNGIFNVRCHPAGCPTVWWIPEKKLGAGRFWVGVSRVPHSKRLQIPRGGKPRVATSVV
ncbi:hypothetical protein QBC32DRAFT_223338, partial [Pseudoneurospora amorphoporcata]